jgi:hypothetical protein
MGLSPLGRRIARQHPDLQKEYAKALPGWKESDVVGSPSSVRAYQLDPELGSWEQLEKVLKKLHDRGIKLILDYNGREKGALGHISHEWAPDQSQNRPTGEILP